MGGVAEEEDVVVAPAVGQLCAEGVLRNPHQFEPFARDVFDPGSDEWLKGFDGREVGSGLTRQ